MNQEINNLLKFINLILVNNSKPEIISISEQTSLRDEIGLDSLDLAELTVRIEQEYNVDVFEDGIVQTIGEILKKIRKNNGEK